MSNDAVRKREARIRDRAFVLWDEAGRPAGGAEAFVGRARELIALEAARSAELHRLFFANEQDLEHVRNPGPEALRAAIEWNLDYYRNQGWL